MSYFDERVGIVTGGGSGIGRATVLRFASEGAALVVADIDDAAGEEAAAAVRANGGRALFVHTDVTDEESVERLVATAISEYGRLDFAHNNAGGTRGAPALTADLPTEVWHATIALNLNSAYYLLKHELKAMLPRGGGAIVVTSSGTGQHAAPKLQAYSAAKHGVIGLCRTAAAEYGKQGMRINVVAPGSVGTPLMRAYLDSDPDRKEARIAELGRASGRLGEPEEIADAVVWLCSDKATFVNGTVIAVDGGRLE